MKNKRVEDYISKLNLIKHPEGGWYREIYKSEELIKQEYLPKRFSGNRHHSTSIYYLLRSHEYSAFHRIKSDEQWHFYDGDTIIIHMINNAGKYTIAKLGRDLDAGEVLQFTVPHSTWFAAAVEKPDSFALVGCTVSPGFHFDDFEMGERKELAKQFPEIEYVISRFTR